MRNEIRRGSESVRLEPKAVEVLVYLAERPGDVVGREELLSAVWPGVVVGDDTLTQAINKLRKALGDDAQRPRYIETISKRGYRLVAPVDHAAAGAAAPPLRKRRWPLLAGGAALVVVAAAAAIHLAGAGKLLRLPWPIAQDPKLVAASLPLVAVLPLANLSGDPKRDYFSDGLTEDLISALGRFSGLRVMSRNAVEPFKTRPPTPQAVRQALGARYVVKGSVREADQRLRVAVELSDADSGTVLWSDRFDGEGRAVFEIQDRIVQRIVGALAVRVTRIERERSTAKAPEDLAAHDLVLRARELNSRLTRDANRQARELLSRAIQLAPDYADAHVALAQAEYRRADQGWMEDPHEGLRRVEALARHALGLPDTGAHAGAHAQLTRVYSQRRDLERALAEANRAVELNPSDPAALYAQGSTLVWLGRLEEGMAAIEAATRYEPHFDNVMSPIGYLAMGRYRDAVAEAERILARSPRIVITQAARTAALGQLGDPEAAAAARQLRRIAPFARAEGFVGNFRNPEHRARFQEGLRKAGFH